MFRAVWVARYGRNLTPEAVRTLEDVLPPELYRDLLNAATSGAPLEYTGPRPREDERTPTKPHWTFTDNWEECCETLWKDGGHGRSLFFHEGAGLGGGNGGGDDGGGG